MLTRLLPPPPRGFRTTVITNAGGRHQRGRGTRDRGRRRPTSRSRPLGLTFRRDVFSLSHVALPFPLSDGLYGLEPDPAEDFGISLGTSRRAASEVR